MALHATLAIFSSTVSTPPASSSAEAILSPRRISVDREFFAAIGTRAAARLVFERLDLGMKAHFAIFIDRGHGVGGAESIVDDFVARENGIVVPLWPDRSTVPTDVIGLRYGSEQFERALCREMRADRADHRADLVDELRDLRLGARGVRSLLPRRNRG